MSIPHSRYWALGLTFFIGIGNADAEPSTAHRTSADPLNAVMELVIAKENRGTLGAAIPVFGQWSEPGWALALPAFVELHNHNDQDFIPNQNWRGFVGLRLQRLWSLNSDKLAGFVVALEHESDHQTSTVFTTNVRFNSMNNVAGYGVFSVRNAFGELRAKAGIRQYLYSNNVFTDSDCCTHTGTEGTVELSFSRQIPQGWAEVFLSLFASSLVSGEGELNHEHRIRVHMGLLSKSSVMDGWQLFVRGQVGNDVGIFRGEDKTGLALVLRWAL